MSEQQFYVQVHFANLLFVDNPVGAGYSYVTNDGAYTRNESQIADDLVALLSVFLTKLPEFQVGSCHATVVLLWTAVEVCCRFRTAGQVKPPQLSARHD